VRALALDDGGLISAFHFRVRLFCEKSLVLERFFMLFVNLFKQSAKVLRSCDDTDHVCSSEADCCG
jgi:hypothetical protein